MIALLGRIFGWFGVAFGKVMADKILMFFAIKAIAVFLFIVVVPILLNNTMYDFIEIGMNFAGGQVGSVMDGSMNFQGFAAYLIEAFRISEALSILIGALSLRLALKMIPLSPI